MITYGLTVTALEKAWLVAGTLKILNKIFWENPHFLPRELMWFEESDLNLKLKVRKMTNF